VDQTGIGDPIVEEFRKRGMDVEGFIFSGPSKKGLVEALVLACDQGRISVPAVPRFGFYREELEAFEYQFSESGEIRYGAPTGMNDDGVMSLALAVSGLRTGDTSIFDFYDRQLRRKLEARFGVEEADRRLKGWETGEIRDVWVGA
jgi:hypothetical protein